MAAQDEGHLPLDRLPLADLKTWLEDNLALDGAANIIGGIPAGGGTTVTINDLTDTGFQRQSGLLVPQGRQGDTGDINATAGDVIFSRFKPPKDVTASGCQIATKQVPTGTSKIDIGIYDTNGTSLLCSTGALAHTGTGWQTYAFTASQALAAGHEYVLAFLNKIDTGTWVYFGDDGFTQALRDIYLTAFTVANWIANGWQARFAGTGWASLQNGGPTGAAVSAHTDPPLAVLTLT